MRAQASLEFILITSAIAAISLSAISLYGKNLAVQRTLLGAISNTTPTNYGQPPQAAGVDNPQIAVYVPVNSMSYAGSSLQAIAYGCAHGTMNLTLSSPSVFFSKNRSSAGISDVAVLSMAFEPLMRGPNTIDVQYTLSCGNATESGSESLSTYAAAPSGNSSVMSYSAYISNRTEKIEYGLEAPTQVINLTEWNYCTQTNFWGSPLPISTQCGASTWGYMVFSGYCYYTKGVSTTSTYCIAPAATGYSTSGISDAASYLYGFSLSLSSPFGIMRAAINGSGASELTLGNETVGLVSVADVGASEQAPEVTLINDGNGYYAADPAALSQYLQAKNSLYGTLHYYNSTGVDDPTQSAIQQSISSFIGASKSLRSGVPGGTSCNVSGGEYIYEPSSPFTYVINVNVSRNLLAENQTLYYMGSEINLFKE